MSVSINQISNHKIAVIGMGYVGLPLATAFGKYRDVIGFDINQARLDDLKKGLDQTREVSASELQEAVYLSFSNNLDEIADCDIYIVTVPTPIKSDKTPDLGPLLSASQMIGKVLARVISLFMKARCIRDVPKKIVRQFWQQSQVCPITKISFAAIVLSALTLAIKVGASQILLKLPLAQHRKSQTLLTRFMQKSSQQAPIKQKA